MQWQRASRRGRSFLRSVTWFSPSARDGIVGRLTPGVKPGAKLLVPLAFAARKPPYIFSMSPVIRQNTALSRFELDVEGDVAFANYRLTDGVAAITYVEVPRSLRQRGVGSQAINLGAAHAAGHRFSGHVHQGRAPTGRQLLQDAPWKGARHWHGAD